MKKDHLTPEDISGYIYRTLDDAQRESMNAHLLGCSTCRASMSQQELRQRQITNDLSAALNAAAPAEKMKFAAIAPQLQPPPIRRAIWSKLSATTPVAFSLAGLFLALYGLWQTLGGRTVTSPPQQMTAFPTLAGFVLVLTSIQQFDQTFTLRPRMLLTWLVAGILWFGSAVIGLLDLIAIRDLAILAVTALDGRNAQAGPIAILAVMVGVMLYIGVVIGGADYHLQNIGQPGSWKLFSLTLLGQVFILILPFLLI